MVAKFVYGLCLIASIACAVLLLRAWHAERTRLLLWSGICFTGLALNNLVLLLDLYFVPDTDLSMLRTGLALAGMVALLFGLIWDSDDRK